MNRATQSVLSTRANRWRFACAAFALLMVPFAAMAQDAVPAPTPALLKSPPVWLGLLVIFLLLALVVSISLLPSKRSHQD